MHITCHAEKIMPKLHARQDSTISVHYIPVRGSDGCESSGGKEQWLQSCNHISIGSTSVSTWARDSGIGWMKVKEFVYGLEDQESVLQHGGGIPMEFFFIIILAVPDNELFEAICTRSYQGNMLTKVVVKNGT